MQGKHIRKPATIQYRLGGHVSIAARIEVYGDKQKDLHCENLRVITDHVYDSLCRDIDYMKRETAIQSDEPAIEFVINGDLSLLESTASITLCGPDNENTIAFTLNGGKTEVLRFNPNGDVFVRGNLVENDKQVVEGIREFLKAVIPL